MRNHGALLRRQGRAEDKATGAAHVGRGKVEHGAGRTVVRWRHGLGARMFVGRALRRWEKFGRVGLGSGSSRGGLDTLRAAVRYCSVGWLS
jgi:hypothetical protein